jgi:8-oxo-dGTP diphosphatase
MICSQPSVIKRVLKEVKALVKGDETLINAKVIISGKKSNLASGSILVAHRAKHQSGRLVAIERYDPLVK